MVGFGILADGALVLLAAVSLLLHELAHILLVKVFGGKVSGFRLGLPGATLWVRGVYRFKPRERYAVYLAGPGVNAIIALAAWKSAQFLYEPPEILQYVFLYNIVLCVFNLLPVFPLDGGRVLQIFLGNRMGVLRANRYIIKAGLCTGSVLMVLGLVQAVLYPWNITLLCAGVYIRRKNKMPAQLYWECLQALLAKNKEHMPVVVIKIKKPVTMIKAVEYLRWDYMAIIKIAPNRVITEGALLGYIGMKGNAV